jgi:PAS domain S-box-containing protein
MTSAFPASSRVTPAIVRFSRFHSHHKLNTSLVIHRAKICGFLAASTHVYGTFTTAMSCAVVWLVKSAYTTPQCTRSPLLPSSRFPRFALAVASLLTALLLIVVEGIRSPARSIWLSDLLQTAIIIWATYCSFHVARRSSDYFRQLWTLLSAALLLSALAQALQTYYQDYLHAPAAAPWPSDVLFILWATPAVMMLVPRAAEKLAGFDWLQLLDFAQVGVVALTAYLYFFYVSSRWEAAGPQMIREIMRVQFLRDAALATGFFIRTATLSRGLLRRFFGQISGLFLTATAADLVYLLWHRTPTVTASWMDIAWCGPYLFAVFIAALWKSEKETIPTEESSRFRVVVVSQVLPIGIPLLVLFMGHRIAKEQLTIAWMAVAASFILSSARLILTSERQRSIADDLLRTKQELLRSEQIFSTAFRSSPDAVGISLIPQGNFVEVNDGFTRLTGYLREEALGKTAAELNLWAEPARRAQIMAKLLDQRIVRDEEFECRMKQGDVRVCLFSGALVELDGSPSALVLVRDITDRKRAEEAKRISEEMFFKAFHSSPDSVTISTLAEGRYLEINDGFVRLLGWTRDELIGRPVADFKIWANPTDRETLKDRLSKEGQVGNFECQLRSKSGLVRTYLLSADVITLNGEACMLAVARDVTERKEAEEALRISEERFRTLVENLHVAVVLLGPDQVIQFANPASLAMFGLKEEQVVGKKASDLDLIAVTEDGNEMELSMRPANRAIATRQPARQEAMGWKRPGSDEVVWIMGEVVPLYRENGELERLISSFSNISERKHAEGALHQLSTRLLQLQDEERRRLGRELHDGLAQSVLAVNLNLAQVRQSGARLEERSRRALSEARRTLQEMSRAIRTLSYLLHPPLLDELGLSSAIKEYAAGFSERSGVELDVDLQADFGRLPQEAETALFRIVQESLSNIQRHSGSRTARIRLRGDLTCVNLEIGDQGHGMAGAALDRNHTPGARLGVGILGMRERMKQLRGKLEIESSSSGTTVRATIPLKIGVSNAASHPRGR